MPFAKEIKYCFNCGVKLPKILTNHCTNCGVKLIEEKEINLKPVDMCTVCHKPIYNKNQSIICPYCDCKYHYSCVASWISKYNACPMCFNVYVSPKLNVLPH